MANGFGGSMPGLMSILTGLTEKLGVKIAPAEKVTEEATDTPAADTEAGDADTAANTEEVPE